MDIAVVTLFPKQFELLADFGVVGRALTSGAVKLHCINPRDHSSDRHRRIDDSPFGGGPGMVMQAEPLARSVAKARSEIGTAALCIYMSPQGQPVTHAMLRRCAAIKQFIIVCGRYEGADERFLASSVDEEWSVGDFVTSGGELPAMCVIDGVIRLLPGVVGTAASVEQDSFVDGLLDFPHYTRPESCLGMRVPAVLRSGDHGTVKCWRRKQALGRTWLRRPDLLAARPLSAGDRELLNAYIDEHVASKSE